MGKSGSKKRKSPVLSGFLKILRTVLVLVLVVALLSAAAGFIPISHPLIDKLVLNDLNKRNVSNCKIGKVVLTPWLGIEFRDVVIGKSFKSGESFYFTAREIKIAGNMVVLLIRNPDIKNELKELLTSISNGYDRPGQFVVSIMKTFEKLDDINEVAIHGKQFMLSSDNGEQFISRNFFCKIMKKGKEFPGMSEIDFSAEDAGVQNGLFINQVNGSFDYKKGILTTTKCKANLYGGRLKIFAGLDLRSDKINKCQLYVSNMDLASFYKNISDAKGSVAGSADITINLQPGMNFFDTLKGRGVVDVNDLCVKDLPLMRPVEMLFSNDINSLEFSKFHLNLKFNGDQKIFTEADGNGPQLDIKAVGWICSDGKLDQSLDGEFSKEMVGKMRSFMAGSLEKTSNNGRSFKCRIYGTLDNPKLELDKATLKKAVGNIFENVKQGLQNIFH